MSLLKSAVSTPGLADHLALAVRSMEPDPRMSRGGMFGGVVLIVVATMVRGSRIAGTAEQNDRG
jgi:hypothetical protein